MTQYTDPLLMTDYTYVLDTSGFLLNNDSISFPFVDVDKVSGLDVAPIRMNINERQSIDGTFVNANHLSMRTVVINGTLYSNVDDPDTICDELRSEYASPTVRQFFFKHPGKPVRFVNAQGGGCQYDVDSNRRLGMTPIQLTLLCADPYIYNYPAQRLTTAQQNVILTPTTLNSNPTFETNVTDWTATGGTIAQSTAFAHSGTGSMAFTPDGVTNTPFINTTNYATVPGNSYSGSVWVYSSSSWATGVVVYLAWYNSGGGFINQTQGTLVALPAATWTNLTVTGTALTAAGGASADAVFARLKLTIAGTPLASQLFYWDDAYLYADPGEGFNWGFNAGFGASTFVTASNVINHGTHDAYPLIYFQGPLTNPSITSALTGLTMKIKCTLGSRDVLVVDNKNKSMVVNGTTSVRSGYNGRQWFTVGSGQSDSFVHKADAGTGTMTVLLYDTYY